MMMLNSCSLLSSTTTVQQTNFIPPTLLSDRQANCYYDTYRDLVDCLLKTQTELKKANHDKKAIASIVNRLE